MDPVTASVAGAAVTGGSQLANGILQGIQDRINIKRQMQANKELAKYQFSKDVEMWNMANDYNSPKAQMARFQEAGLNPNLIYSQGNPGNTATALPKYNAPTADYSRVSPLVQLPNLLSLYQDFQMKQAQTDNIKANTKATEAKTLTEIVRKGLVDAQLVTESKRPTYIEAQTGSEVQRRMNLQQQNDIRSKMLPGDMSYQRLKNKAVELDNVQRAQKIIYQFYVNEFKAMGINDSDHPVVRILGRVFGDYIDPKAVGKGTVEGGKDIIEYMKKLLQ